MTKTDVKIIPKIVICEGFFANRSLFLRGQTPVLANVQHALQALLLMASISTLVLRDLARARPPAERVG